MQTGQSRAAASIIALWTLYGACGLTPTRHVGVSGCSAAHRTNSAHAIMTRVYGRPSTSRKQTAHTGASASAAHDEPPAVMSPIRVVPNFNDSSRPARMTVAMRSAFWVRRLAMTWRSQPTKSGPGGTTPRRRSGRDGCGR